MLKHITFILLLGIGNFLFADEIDSLPQNNEVPMHSFELQTHFVNDTTSIFYVDNFELFSDEWHALARPNFWRTVMNLSADSCLINNGNTREVYAKMSVAEWKKKSSKEKDTFRDSIRTAQHLAKDNKIFMTVGKQDYYNFEGILSSISNGVQAFQNNQVDPWYAQAILMIESPGRLQRSHAGAYGPFQLMPNVARKFGLTVSRYRDDRSDFQKSAEAASQLISTICIPEAKKILDEHQLSYREHDLWFRLFVLHVYHAGAYNVKGVVNQINPTEGGLAFMEKMWTSAYGRYGNASQNYSQIALAAMITLDDILWGCTSIAGI